MCRSCFESFIRNGGTKTFVLNLGHRLPLELKQDAGSGSDVIREWIDENWNPSFGATSQAILKTKPFEFSAAGLSELDQDALRVEAAAEVAEAMTREGFTLDTADGQRRALTVLFGFLNRVQQEAMGIDFYVWTTQHDRRVREGHAERDDRIFRWDDPPEGGHPSQDFGCRCYARALGIEGYWHRVKPSVDAFAFEAPGLEDSIDYMYLDSEDNVTVGIGTLLASADAAAALAFRNRETDKPATDEEIRAEFVLIDAMVGSGKIAAGYYREFTSLYLPQAEIDRLVVDHMRGDFDALLRVFPYFGNYPESVQIALWDMSYNLGVGGLSGKFPKFCQAIRDEDWEEAATESHREGIADERNEFVFGLLMDAVVP